MSKAKLKTKKKPIYKPLIELPPLTPEEYEGLRNSIAVSGVLIPIVVWPQGRIRYIIDGDHRKKIADDLGYDCPETVLTDLTEEEARAMARALNLARRQLNTAQKRAIIADQLQETPEKTNRVIAKMLGVHHTTVGSVRGDLASVGEFSQLDRRVGADGKTYKATKAQPVPTKRNDRENRMEAATLLHGDCRDLLKTLPKATVNLILTDPPYPEVHRKDYPRTTEAEWHQLMHEVVVQCRRVLKPNGSAVIILQSNAKKQGRMRTWLWEFATWAGKEWGIVQDCYWWAIDAMPIGGTRRDIGLLRPSIKMCLWLGEPNCYRCQEKVLWTPSDAAMARRRSDKALRTTPSGRTFRHSSIGDTMDERGGSTPFNLLPLSGAGGEPADTDGHPTPTPFRVADWWCRYLLPPGGVLLDPFVGSGTMLLAGLDNGASSVIGIDREARFLKTAKRRIAGG